MQESLDMWKIQMGVNLEKCRKTKKWDNPLGLTGGIQLGCWWGPRSTTRAHSSYRRLYSTPAPPPFPCPAKDCRFNRVGET